MPASPTWFIYLALGHNAAQAIGCGRFSDCREATPKS